MKFNNIYQEFIQFSKKKRTILQKIQKGRRMRYICIITLLLLGIGFINMYSTTIFMNIARDRRFTSNIGFSYLKHAIIGIVAMVPAFFLDYRIFNNKKIFRFLIPVSIFSLMIIRIMEPFNNEIFKKIGGAYAWIKIPGTGLNLQPSELVKIIFILHMAFTLSKTMKNREKDDLKIFLINSTVPFLIMGAVVFQRDIGTAIHYFSIYLFMLFMSEIKLKFFKIFGFFSGLGISLGAYIISKMDVSGSEGHIKPRIHSWINGLFTGEYDSGYGFQVRQGLMGLGNGGVLGKGLGEGVFKYEYIPEIHTDFVIAAFGEEWGLIGILILMLLFFTLFNQTMKVANNSKDFYGKYVVYGLSSMIYSQFLINISVAIGLLPVFGIPMPFLSYGGTSLMTMLITIALILNVDINNNKKIKNT